jgi:hypothetical protein
MESITLPKEVVFHILEYTGKFKIRKNELVSIISLEDERYDMLRSFKFYRLGFHRNSLTNQYTYFLNISINCQKMYKILVDFDQEITFVNVMEYYKFDKFTLCQRVLSHNYIKY